MGHSNSLKFQVNWFYCTFYYPCKRNLRVLFSIYYYILVFSLYVYILLLLHDLSHSTQIKYKSLLSLSPEFHPQLQKIKLFPACSSRKGTSPSSNIHGQSTVINLWDRIKDIFAIWRKHYVTMGLFWKFKRWHPGCVRRTRSFFFRDNGFTWAFNKAKCNKMLYLPLKYLGRYVCVLKLGLIQVVFFFKVLIFSLQNCWRRDVVIFCLEPLSLTLSLITDLFSKFYHLLL